MIYCIDENGKTVDFLEERNNQIKKTLSKVLKEFQLEKLDIKRGDGKLGYRFAKQLQAVLASYGQMTNEQAEAITYEMINNYWLKYLDLTAYYNRYFEIIDNKQLFMLFCGINDRIYSKWEKSDDEDIRNLMSTINSQFIGFGFIAGESGMSNPIATKMRLTAKDVGHSVISASEDLAFQTVAQKTPLELGREINAILGIEENPKKRGKKNDL